MNPETDFGRCLTFINCQLQPPHRYRASDQEVHHRRTVTISRQTGAGAHVVAETLAQLLQARAPEESCPWTIFDRNLVEKVLADHHLPNRLGRFMAEDRISEIADTLDELFGLHPPSWMLVHKTAETILHLAELGHVILIGRGATVITGKLDYVLHVRLVCPLEKRVRFIRERDELSHKAALEKVRAEDLGRTRFLKKYFGKDIDDPLLYHLTLNTGLISWDEAARLIAEALEPKASLARLAAA